jgi:hypothetical protein
LGLSFLPYSAQPVLDAYVKGAVNQDDLFASLTRAGVVNNSTLSLYAPLFQLAKSRRIDLLALSPEPQDIQSVRQQGLQNVDPKRRSTYVIDPNGFIALTQEPRYQLYTDRSLLKDYQPLENGKYESSAGNFYSERILVHEAAATAVAQYAAARPESLVVTLSPTADVRFLNGLNGRIPRIFKLSNPVAKVNANSITTILLNPLASETLSKSRYLRLEIGTGPDTLDYQQKVADYLWFSQTPKVNLLPRLMN